MQELTAMFGTKLQRYGERKAEEGRQESREEVAVRMLERGFPIDEVAELTGLSSQKVEALRK